MEHNRSQYLTQEFEDYDYQHNTNKVVISRIQVYKNTIKSLIILEIHN